MHSGAAPIRVHSYPRFLITHLRARTIGTRGALSAGMRKTSKRARRTTRQTPDRAATVDIVSQLECAAKNPQATAIGALIGGVVPWFANTLAHGQLPSAWSAGNMGLAMVMLVVVLGCALFSALTVYKFGRAAFGCQKKALGFTLALEGVMLVSTGTTSVAALIVLIAINALANGSVIALAREATQKRRAAVVKSSETRARKSVAARVAPAAIPTTPARKALPKVQWEPMMTEAIELTDLEEICS